MNKLFPFFTLLMASVASAADVLLPFEMPTEASTGTTSKISGQTTRDFPTDKEATCYGETFGPVTFPTQTNDNIDEASFVGRYSNAVSGNTYKCAMTCDDTSGLMAIQAFTTPDDKIVAGTTGSDVETGISYTGCSGGGLTVTVTATQNANLFVFFGGSLFNGVNNARASCTEECNNNVLKSVYSRMTGMLGFGGGHRHLEKYVRGGGERE